MSSSWLSTAGNSPSPNSEKRSLLSFWIPFSSWLFFLVFWFSGLPAQAALQLRVALEEGIGQLQVGTSTPAVVKDGSGKPIAQMGSMQGVRAVAQRNAISLGRRTSSQFWIEPSENGLVWIGDAWYRGSVQLISSPQGLIVVNHVDLEDYLYSVVGSEMPPSWPLEALKAQAVAARSYALYKRSKVANTVYDLGNTTTWQVYKGVQGETTSTQAAVQQTSTQVLTYQGSIIEAVFHSSSGGHTENVEDVWTQALPYLRGVADYDQQSPVFAWTETVSAAQMRNSIPGIGNIVSLTPIATTPYGRVRQLKVVGDAGQTTLSGEQFRTALDLRSSLFAVVPQGQAAGSAGKSTLPNTFIIQGRGFGHGLGLSQWGAYGLAQQGYNYQQILGHYYRNASLARVQVSY
ncbi:MAG: SpoIID/LytB domain-containing protein [Prochlorotrichaceae cyanobacterium]